MKAILFAAAGAALGGACRYSIAGSVHRILPPGFPYGTLTVNVMASFILTFILLFFEGKSSISPSLKLLLTSGFCGGFSTFSTFSYDTVALLQDSKYFLAGANVVLNVLLTIGAVFLAFALVRLLR